VRTSFHHQSEAQPPNGTLTAATSPDTPSHMPSHAVGSLWAMSGLRNYANISPMNVAMALNSRWSKQRAQHYRQRFRSASRTTIRGFFVISPAKQSSLCDSREAREKTRDIWEHGASFPIPALEASNNHQPADGPSPAGRNYVEGGGANGTPRFTTCLLTCHIARSGGTAFAQTLFPSDAVLTPFAHRERAQRVKEAIICES
jgi:hypothetical protein